MSSKTRKNLCSNVPTRGSPGTSNPFGVSPFIDGMVFRYLGRLVTQIRDPGHRPSHTGFPSYPYHSPQHRRVSRSGFRGTGVRSGRNYSLVRPGPRDLRKRIVDAPASLTLCPKEPRKDRASLDPYPFGRDSPLRAPDSCSDSPATSRTHWKGTQQGRSGLLWVHPRRTHGRVSVPMCDRPGLLVPGQWDDHRSFTG